MGVAAENAVFEQIDTPIGGVHPEQVMAIWDRVEPILRRVVKPNTGYTLESVRQMLLTAQFQLWVVGDFKGVIVTQVQARHTGPVLWGQFMAGDNMKEWLSDWIAVQEEYARHLGCVAVEFCGRKGWNRVVEKHPEYKATWTVFRREF